MEHDEQVSISITLSPTQVDEVVRAAAQSRAPSISTLITTTLTGQPALEHEAQSSTAPSLATRKPSGESSAIGYPPIDTSDPRLSRSLLRGLSLLTCFDSDGASRGIVELAHIVGLSPSTTHRYAATLVEFGLLEQCPKSRKYRLPGS